MNFKKTIALSLAACAIIGLSGCGGSDKKAPVSADKKEITLGITCLLYTSDAADDAVIV